jgi:hypothetical protein
MDNLLYKVAEVILWISDEVALMYSQGYTPNFFGFETVSQTDLDTITNTVNTMLGDLKLEVRIYNDMGEIFLTRKEKQ